MGRGAGALRILVTGASGFLGSHVARELVSAGHAVTAAGGSRPPGVRGARNVQLDLRDYASVEAAVEGAEAICHVAALTGIWGPLRDFFEINMGGTQRLLHAATKKGVERFVFTSSPSVCFDGRDHVRAGNDLPYAARFLSPYPASKAAAEKAVLASNGIDGLSTCALRPHLVIGPGDPHLLPRLIERGRAGKLMRVGNGRNEVSLTWVENAARAHRLAVEALRPESAPAGKAYFLAQEDPVELWSWIDALFERLKVPPVRRSLPLAVARTLGAACELAWHLGRFKGEPPMTRFLALQLASSHSYDLEPVRRDLGYAEEVDMGTATERLVAAYAGRASSERDPAGPAGVPA